PGVGRQGRRARPPDPEVWHVSTLVARAAPGAAVKWTPHRTFEPLEIPRMHRKLIALTTAAVALGGVAAPLSGAADATTVAHRHLPLPTPGRPSGAPQAQAGGRPPRRRHGQAARLLDPHRRYSRHTPGASPATWLPASTSSSASRQYGRSRKARCGTSMTTQSASATVSNDHGSRSWRRSPTSTRSTYGSQKRTAPPRRSSSRMTSSAGDSRLSWTSGL